MGFPKMYPSGAQLNSDRLQQLPGALRGAIVLLNGGVGPHPVAELLQIGELGQVVRLHAFRRYVTTESGTSSSFRDNSNLRSGKLSFA